MEKSILLFTQDMFALQRRLAILHFWDQKKIHFDLKIHSICYRFKNGKKLFSTEPIILASYVVLEYETSEKKNSARIGEVTFKYDFDIWG